MHTMKRCGIILLLVALSIGHTGCETTGSGMTKRKFNQAWESLEAGLTPDVITARLGEPREKHPASEETLAIWIYSQPETVGTRTNREDVTVSPDGKTIPVYETEEVYGNVEYHLRWQHGYLVSWERIAPKMRF